MSKSPNVMQIEERIRETRRQQETAASDIVAHSKKITERLLDLRQHGSSDFEKGVAEVLRDLFALIKEQAILVSATQRLGADELYRTMLVLHEPR